MNKVDRAGAHVICCGINLSETAIKCYCISDLQLLSAIVHADTTKNQQWLKDNWCRLSSTVTTHD